MLNLFETFDQASLDFLNSQKITNIKVPTVVLNDDGFLPQDVDSPVQYYCELPTNGQPMYFDQLPIPRYWKINANSTGAQVYDVAKKRADVVFSANDNSRFVKEVHWLNNDGKINWVDHYDQHGQYFAKTYYHNNQPVLRRYYNRQGQKVIEHNLRIDDVFLSFKGNQRHFASFNDLVVNYLQECNYNLDHVFYNTLNKTMAVSLRLPAGGSDTLLWHEKINGNEIPGNMQYLMDNQTRTKHVIFQNYRDWQRHSDFLPDDTGNVDVNYLGFVYPHPRSNNLRPTALILTNSDDLEQLDQLTTLLPNVTFNVAAVTEMSEKLLAFGDRANVNLYPTVSSKRTKQLIKDCDVYFDINRGNEILDAVRGAFEQNMLIVGFKDTLHRPQLVAPENVYQASDVRNMAQKVLTALVKPALMKKLIDQQRLMASDTLTDDFKKGMEVLMHD
ncbi:accessory Sec system glycosylation chaperone GtfB [Limosilactobacillus sp.]|uniref:accessory Sec system glycosylation chaperone GtfB n=1 Tax=Limosilactobacillus sp. TaxID=2773925 RepID=UPI00345E6608